MGKVRIGHKHFVKDSAVSMRPRNRIPQSQWDRGNRSRGLIETVGYMKKKFQFYLHIFGCALPEPHNFSCRIPWSQWDRGIRHENFCQDFCGLNETGESFPAVSMRPQKFYDTPGILTNEYWFSFPLKGNHRKNQYRCKHYIPIVTSTRKRKY
jgi:hypothetical protein